MLLGLKRQYIFSYQETNTRPSSNSHLTRKSRSRTRNQRKIRNPEQLKRIRITWLSWRPSKIPISRRSLILRRISKNWRARREKPKVILFKALILILGEIVFCLQGCSFISHFFKKHCGKGNVFIPLKYPLKSSFDCKV